MKYGFYVRYHGQDGQTRDGFELAENRSQEQLGNGVTRDVATYISIDGHLAVDDICLLYDGSPVTNKTVAIRNISNELITVERIDSMNWILPKGSYQLDYYTSGRGGMEFIPQSEALKGTKILQVTTGRSSRGMHPWFLLGGSDGSLRVCTFAWTGNWIARLTPGVDGTYTITGGLSDWCFSKILKPGEGMNGIDVIMIDLQNGDRDDASIAIGRWGRRWWYPMNDLSEQLAVEWNHWNAYADLHICEKAFLDNVRESEKLGFGACVLDAGWFGDPEFEAEWFQHRGDWDIVNSRRFPNGIAFLADEVHRHGMKFGLWCEIEALGKFAKLNRTHPEFAAERNSEPLGYVCFGSPAVQEWAFSVLEKLISEFHVDWILVDFNLDMGAGCNRIDHGHEDGDGLYGHILGLYHVLDRVRQQFPDVLLENCSSGGFRTDLGIMHHVHKSFLSDSVSPDNAFQVFWAAVDILHPSVCIHYAFADNADINSQFQFDNPLTEDMEVWKLDYYVRNMLLKSPGFSWKLPILPEWCKKRVADHIRFQKKVVAGIIRNACLYRLTGQTLRTGEGDRWSGLEYVSESGEAILLFVFRLVGSEPAKRLILKGLAAGAYYEIKDQDSGHCFTLSGENLMNEGLVFRDMPIESSKVYLIEKLNCQ